MCTQFYEKKYFFHKKDFESHRKRDTQVNKIFVSNNFANKIFIFLMIF